MNLLRAALIRATRTAAQVVLATFGTEVIAITDMPWTASLSLAAGAAVVSLLQSVVSGLPEVDGRP